ncbi:hypothetical protein D3C78_1079030 [compost metagenome]
MLGLGNFCADGVAIVVVQGGGTGTHRQLADFLQHGIDAVQHAFFLRLGRIQCVDVGGVLAQQGFLLLELQQPRGTDRIVRRRLQLDATTGLLGRLHHVVEVALIVGSSGRVVLCSGNSHVLRLLKGH